MVSIFPESAPFPDTMDTMSEFQNPWPAPLATRPLSATVTIPGSKSLSNRYLILAAMGQHPVTLVGLLRSRDTDLMMGALRSLGVEFQVDPDVETTLESIADPILTTVTRLYNRANGDHVWSTDANEVKVLSAQADWNNENAAFFVPTYTGDQAVTRLYKNNRHLLSTDSNEVKVLSTKQGWSNEGTAFKAY